MSFLRSFDLNVDLASGPTGALLANRLSLDPADTYTFIAGDRFYLRVYFCQRTGLVSPAALAVPHQLLDFSHGSLRIRDIDEDGRPLASSRFPDPAKYMIHRGHLLTSPDSFGGPMRSLVFWWLLGSQDRDWWGRFLERFGAPFIVAKYEQGDDKSRSTIARALNLATRVFGLVVSRDTQIELIQSAAASTGDAFDKFHSVCQREKSKLILGQTLSAEAQPTGLGSGVADGQAKVRDDIRQFDSMTLGHTFATQLFAQIRSANGWTGSMPTVTWGGESSDEASASGTMIASLHQAGIEPTDEGIDILSKRFGIPLRRSTAPRTGLTSMLPLSVDADLEDIRQRADLANDSIARTAAADLSRAFRGSLAPVGRIIRSSKSSDACLAAIEALYADMPTGRRQEILDSALVAFAANGIAITR